MKWSETPQGKLARTASDRSDQGKHSEALELLDRALEIKHDDPVVLTHYGAVLRKLQRLDEAEKPLRAALRIDQELTPAWDHLGMVYQEREEFEKAAYCYEQSARITPRAAVLTMLANVQLTFDPHKSLENAREALSLDPQWDEAQKILDSARREIRRLGSNEP
jgi:tetratricopeptide (TPR) repeat protein